jgi:hypothetical protein
MRDRNGRRERALRRQGRFRALNGRGVIGKGDRRRGDDRANEGHGGQQYAGGSPRAAR